MCSYNSFQGLPSCTNPALLTSLLRGTLGFHGFVVTDKGALDVAAAGGFAGGSARRAAAAAVQAGVDAIMKNSSALDPADLAPGELDAAAARVLAARFRCGAGGRGRGLSERGALHQLLPPAAWHLLLLLLKLDAVRPACRRMGHFDPPERLPWASLNASAIGAAEHAATARQIAAEGTVLLKNAEVGGGQPAARIWSIAPGPTTCPAVAGPCAGPAQRHRLLATPLPCLQGTLPLRLGALRTLAVIGPFADQTEYILVGRLGSWAGNAPVCLLPCCRQRSSVRPARNRLLPQLPPNTQAPFSRRGPTSAPPLARWPPRWLPCALRCRAST